MKQQIYQNGFYLLLGLILGVSIATANNPKSTENTIRIELVKDSAKVTPKTVKVIKPSLNENNLKAELIKQNIPHHNIVLAQAKLESGNFKSDLARTHQNIFGLKKGSKYRKYNHWTECVSDYKRFISNRYKGGNYYVFLNKIGYATHPNYVEMLKELV